MIVPEPGLRVLDVGCGTGISTRGLLEAGAEVVAIDPNDAMRSAAERNLTGPDVPLTLAHGSGESTGQADAAFDRVLCAQSFHWFHADRALAEFRRVLRPDGALVLMWNDRDRRGAAAAAYEAIVLEAQQYTEAQGRRAPPLRAYAPSPAQGFEVVATHDFDNPQSFDHDALRGRLLSASYMPKDGPMHTKLLAALDALYHAHAEDGIVTLAQRAQLTVCRPLAT